MNPVYPPSTMLDSRSDQLTPPSSEISSTPPSLPSSNANVCQKEKTAPGATSKGGVISLTRTIAREFGPMGVRANVVCPSMTETGMLDGNVTAEQFSDIVNAIPLRRAGRASDIAGACLFLASDLSAYVTGATIDVNGGSHIH